jgi:hypothetical protein
VAAGVSLAGQTRKQAAPVPRTADGRPDLQGTWDFAQLTPLERPGNFAGKQTLTDDEAEEFAQQKIETGNKDRRDGGAAADVERAYKRLLVGLRHQDREADLARRRSARRPHSADDRRRAATDCAGAGPLRQPGGAAARRTLSGGFNSGPPMVPSAYNNNVQVVQTRDHVIILNEMIHNARVVDLNRREHQPKAIRFLTGDSIGRWDGDTLVVDTTNFSSHGGFRGASPDLHLVEKFTRVDRDALRYEFTIDDPRRGREAGRRRFRWSVPTS